MTSESMPHNAVDMKEIPAPDAQARLDELLDEVEHGEIIVITRDGKAVARLVPDEARRREEIGRAMTEIKEMRRHTRRVTIEEILAWRDRKPK